MLIIHIRVYTFITHLIFSRIVNTLNYPTNILRYLSVLIRRFMYILAVGQLAWLYLCKQIVRRVERFTLARYGLLVVKVLRTACRPKIWEVTLEL